MARNHRAGRKGEPHASRMGELLLGRHRQSGVSGARQLCGCAVASRVAVSIRTGTVRASLIMRQLASYPRQNGVVAALRELGRLERTLLTLDCSRARGCAGRRAVSLITASHATAWRAAFIHRLGEIRDRTYENQQHLASGLNLLVTAIILWNTRLPRARRCRSAPGRRSSRPPSRSPVAPRLGARQSDGRLCLVTARPDDGNHDRFRPLRTPPDAAFRTA